MTKLRVKRPRARPYAEDRATSSPSMWSNETDDGGQVRPSHDRTSPPCSPVRAAASTYSHARRVAALQHRQRRHRLPAGLPVHRPEQRDLGLGPVAAERVGRERRVQVTAAGRVGEPVVARHRGQHPRLQLAGVGHHERPARIGHHRAPHHLGDLQRSAAARRPPARHHPARHVLRQEPAAAHPLLAPRPAVRHPDPVQLLVLQQRRDRRMVDLPQHPRPRVRDRDALAGERPDHLRRRVRVAPAARRASPRSRPSARPAGAAARPSATARRAGRAAARRARRPATAARPGPSPRPPGPRPTRPRPGAGTASGRASPRSGRAGRAYTATTSSMVLAGTGGAASNSVSCASPGGTAARAGGSGGTGRPASRAAAAATAARIAPPPLGSQQQRLGQLQVVAPVHADAAAQQPRIDLHGGRPEPAHGVVGLDAGGVPRRPHRLTRVVEIAQPHAAAPVRMNRSHHGVILPAGVRQFYGPAFGLVTSWFAGGNNARGPARVRSRRACDRSFGGGLPARGLAHSGGSGGAATARSARVVTVVVVRTGGAACAAA